MRTTVTIDPDVEALLRSAIRESGAPFKPVPDDNALRDGLPDSAKRANPERFRQRTFDMGEELVDLTNAHALADELGDLALIEKMRRL